MSGSYWEAVRETGLSVPSDRPLDELTAELTRMLGDPDPEIREALAHPALSTWIAQGVYDDLLSGLGDGMAAGLVVGLGDADSDSVFRRSYSALVLGACIARDNERPLVPGGKVLEWGDRVATWLLRERDLRGFVVGKGWAHAVAHGADALATLASSPHVATPELTVILDVVADRVLAPVAAAYGQGEPDRLARATMAVLRRDLVPLTVVEPWVARIGASTAVPAPDAGNAEAFLRALYLQLALGPHPPEVRADLLLTLVEVLRRRNADLRRR
ncbi:DUF2785 domain-containing protein [Nocardioides sp. BP30]|uniref:DUF2785 domain-containing protein n=1 Tax=Nocardioides sp. BP30 TaxID=3036374 RepID=UPI0024688620|nr:DUF2785 domain-containing protein [Nocardioides sp. BP30]WGL51304.1 DUF2785 domain-containing protein [Nocardioides sp. BP30]